MPAMIWTRSASSSAFPRSCRVDRRRHGIDRLQIPHRLHGREGVRNHRLMTPRGQAGEAEVAGQRHLVGDHEIPLARDAVEHGVAREAEADAGFDEVDHGLFLVGEGDALRQRAHRPEDVVEQPPMRRVRRRRKPGQVDQVGPVLAHHLVAPFRRRDHAVVVAHQRRELEFAAFDVRSDRSATKANSAGVASI